MRYNLLLGGGEPLTRGPGRRARNLEIGLTRLGIDYEVCGDDFSRAIGLQLGCVSRYFDSLPAYTPIGPNVVHEPSAHTLIAAKFKNFVVQSQWVAEYWKWACPELCTGYNFYIYPASVDMEDGFREIAKNRKPEYECLLYTKYQNNDNRFAAEKLFSGHSSKTIEYSHYTLDELKAACSGAKYCVFNSCCEKSSNALLEILACGVPVFVIDSVRWIGDDRFDKCTSAPQFDDRCGMINTREGSSFDKFKQNVAAGVYKPSEFIEEGYTAEKVAKIVIDIIERCQP
jgi:hypothetical protein